MGQNGQCCSHFKTLPVIVMLINTLLLAGVYLKLSTLIDIYVNGVRHGDGRMCPMSSGCNYFMKGNGKGPQGAMQDSMKGPMDGPMEGPVDHPSPTQEMPTGQQGPAK